jgi:hypothetical protein
MKGRPPYLGMTWEPRKCSIRLVIKLGYDAVELPELNVVAVDKLFCGFDRGLVIETIKLNCSNEMAIEANDINPVSPHSAASSAHHAFTGIARPLFGPGLQP